MSRFPHLALLAGLLALLCPALADADDTALFATSAPPNVMLLVDNSGSMHELVWHPAFDPDVATTCNFFSTVQFFSTNQIGWTVCGKTINVYVDPNVSPGADTRFNPEYLNWLFSPESNPYNADIEAAANGTKSACLGGGSFSKYRRSRITALEDILREVICQVNAAGKVRFGIAQFRRGADPAGGYVVVPINDYLKSDGTPNVYTLNGVSKSHANHLGDAITKLTGEANTPLGESLFQVYTSFMPRTDADLPLGKDGVTKFPVYSYRTSTTVSNGGKYTTTTSDIPIDPVVFDCQKNFVIVLTDGEPTRDDFDLLAPDDKGFADFKAKLIGDYNLDAEIEDGIYASEGAMYLDDIAKFMHEKDFRPDIDGKQTLDVYTVGFTTTDFANSLLQKAANVGNGSYYTSTDPDALAASIVDSITDIIEKSQSFSAATVPASRTAEGDRFYTSSFVPSEADGFWTGHLESWTITPSGEIWDVSDACALDDPNAPECFGGPFKEGAVPFWDAGEEVPAVRKLETTQLSGPGSSVKLALTPANMTAALLTVTAADIPTYTYPGASPADAEALADLITASLQGCAFGTGAGAVPCTTRPWLLGDIFHSAPVVVGPPTAYFPEASYVQFATDYATRDRVVAVGANDGFFRLIHAGDWDAAAIPPAYDPGTGTELAGFMPYAVRRKIKELPRDTGSRDAYTVDGSPTVAEAWFYTTPTETAADKLADGSEWRTVAVSGLRQGGRAYFALDVSDPAAAGYPGYLWEFPREDAAAGITDYMGESWSEPIVTKIRVRVNGDDNGGQGYERWVAVVGGGYDPKSDPNAHASYAAGHLGGRAILILDLKTGKILARKKFDPAAAPGDPESQMLYAFASTPGVYDLDFDGYADVIYIGDLGGNVWKWVIKNAADDIVNGAGSEDQNDPAVNWKFKKFFTAPTYATGGNTYYKSFYFAPSATLKSGKLWLAFGSGERSNLSFAGFAATTLENNRFYTATDLDPLEKLAVPYPVLAEADLTDVTGDSSCSDVSGTRGLFFLGVDGEKFITNSDIFFHYVFTSSFVPDTSGDPCTNGGSAALYAFKIYCGEGLFEDGAGNPLVKLSLGDGLPTEPRISLGSEGGGSRVIVTHGSRDEGLTIGSEDTGFDPQEATGQAYWRQLTQ